MALLPVRVAPLGSKESWSLFGEVQLFPQQKKPRLADDSTSAVITTARRMSEENSDFFCRDFEKDHLLTVRTAFQGNRFIYCKSMALVPFNDTLAIFPQHLTFITARLPQS